MAWAFFTGDRRRRSRLNSLLSLPDTGQIFQEGINDHQRQRQSIHPTIHLSELVPFISRDQPRDEVRRAGGTPVRNPGEPRSDDSGHRPPPDRLAATPGLVGRGLRCEPYDTPIIRGEVDRKLAPLSSGEAMTVVDPSIRYAAGWTVPRSPTSSWAWRAGLFFIQEQWQ